MRKPFSLILMIGALLGCQSAEKMTPPRQPQKRPRLLRRITRRMLIQTPGQSNTGRCALKKSSTGAMNMSSANGLTTARRPMNLANIMATSNIKAIVGELTSALNPSQLNHEAHNNHGDDR